MSQDRPTLSGLTWDHPRGYAVLETLGGEPPARWERQPLEGLESRPLRELAKRGGQSADRRAWLDPDTDARAGGFYSATRATVEAAWVRPRFAGYLEFQARASAVPQDGPIGGEDHARLLGRVNELFTRSVLGV